MNALKAEMERKRKATEELKRAASSEPSNSSNKRFLAQKDVLLSQEMQHMKEQRVLDERRAVSSGGGSSSSSGGHIHSSSSDNAFSASTVTVSDSQHHNDNSRISNSSSSAALLAEELQADADRAEVERKYESLRKLSSDRIRQMLRNLGQAVTFFGESADDRILRLQGLQERLETIANETDDFKLDTKSGHNIRNVFLSGGGGGGGGGDGVRSRSSVPDEDDDEEADADGGDKSGKASFDPREPEPVFHKAEGITDEMIVYKYLKRLVKWWDYDLQRRSGEERSTAKGRLDSKTFHQCKDYLRPLFKLCLKRQVHRDILERLVEIVRCCETGDFRMANDAYIRVAIGNSAWPIGITMVGIHERSSREKISSSNVAHAMNNELQRKYLTSVKRLVTFAQTKREDVAPSMKVL